jgi:hypothetical protein
MVFMAIALCSINVVVAGSDAIDLRLSVARYDADASEDPTIVIADDNCSYVVEFKADTTGVYPFDFIITRKWKVKYECDNMVMESQKIIVKDDVPPTTCDPEDKEIECEGIVSNESVTAAWNASNISKLESCSSDVCGEIHVTSD